MNTKIMRVVHIGQYTLFDYQTVIFTSVPQSVPFFCKKAILGIWSGRFFISLYIVINSCFAHT